MFGEPYYTIVIETAVWFEQRFLKLPYSSLVHVSAIMSAGTD